MTEDIKVEHLADVKIILLGVVLLVEVLAWPNLI